MQETCKTNKAVSNGGGVVEPASLIAFIVYAAVGGLILAVVNGLLLGGSGRGILRHA